MFAFAIPRRSTVGELGEQASKGKDKGQNCSIVVVSKGENTGRMRGGRRDVHGMALALASALQQGSLVACTLYPGQSTVGLPSASQLSRTASGDGYEWRSLLCAIIAVC